MIRKIIKEQIKEYFFINPTVKLRVRWVERTLKLPLPSVIRYCKELEVEGILKRIKIENIVLYASDRTNEVYLLEKKLFNIKQIHYSGLVNHIKETLNNPVIVLFGSYSKGEDIETSDIDLYIESPSKKSIDLSKFEKILQRKIQVFKFVDIKKVSNKHLANNIINGIALNNYIEVFR